MPRYVLLRHECVSIRSGSHWDLMLEHEGVLAAWAVEALPSVWADSLGLGVQAACEVNATKLPDHRIAYLEYEGPVSRDRGSVVRAAAGTYEPSVWSEDRIGWDFDSGDLSGVVEMTRNIKSDWSLSATADGSR